MVIACPCALVISTPITVVCGLHRATRFGLLVKGGEHLETAGRLTAMALDKTGTLTEGRPELVDIRYADKAAKDDVLRIAAALETQSEHPLARAIVQAARDLDLSVPVARDFKAVRGFGVGAVVDGHECAIGGARYFQVERPDVEVPADWLSDHPTATPAFIARGPHCIGAVYLADRPRCDAIQATRQLRTLGVDPLVMLTGDRHGVAAHVAEAIGIDRFHADLLPEDKVDRVRQLTRSHANTAMVGDGVNDAPALASASVGIAMGAAGTDTALETADVALMADDLSKLPYLFQLSRTSLSVIRQNVWASILIKVILAVGVFPGLVSLVMAVLVGDMGTSLGVTGNAMRLAQVRPGVFKEH